jgi:hypothetical protein
MASRAEADGNRDTYFRKLSPMKRSLQTSALCFRLRIETKRLNAYFSMAVILLTGCSATQVRWDATKMRKDVMVYYNDQIMDNLIRAYNRLPFVHVDITLLTSQGGSQITGTIGAGESRTSTNTSKSIAGALGTIANAVTRPFAYSVTPQQTETLTISTAPALGNQTVAAQEQTQPKVQLTKYTEETEITYPTPTPTPSPGTPSAGTPSPGTPSAGTQSAGTPSAGTPSAGTPSAGTRSPTTKKTITSENQPTQSTIYDLYEKFADRYVKYSLTRPNKDDVLPGTVIKLWGGYYYYIVKGEEAKDAYYKFCRALFTKGQAGLSGTAVQQGLAAPLAVPSFR